MAETDNGLSCCIRRLYILLTVNSGSTNNQPKNSAIPVSAFMYTTASAALTITLRDWDRLVWIADARMAHECLFLARTTHLNVYLFCKGCVGHQRKDVPTNVGSSDLRELVYRGKIQTKQSARVFVETQKARRTLRVIT